MPHIHLSIQAGDDLVLKRMKRRHSRAGVLAACKRARDLRPGVALGADLIAGFPTESEAMFRNTLDLVGEAGLDYLHVFPFSARERTPAARMPQSPRALVKERAARLRAAGVGALARSLASRVGGEARVLVEKPGFGRSEHYAPVAFEGGQPGELFITMAKEGSTIGGLMDSIGTLTSMALQYGVPLEALVRKFAHQRFEPSGFTKNPEIRNASSITDYVFRWLALQFVPGYREAITPNRAQPELAMPGLLEEVKKKVNRPVPELPIAEDNDVLEVKAGNGNGYHAPAGRMIKSLSDSIAHFQQDAPTCPTCGHVAVRNGACYKCLNCGESLGCS